MDNILEELSQEINKLDERNLIKPIIYKIIYTIIQPFRVAIIVFIILIIMLVITQIFTLYRINQLYPHYKIN